MKNLQQCRWWFILWLVYMRWTCGPSEQRSAAFIIIVGHFAPCSSKKLESGATKQNRVSNLNSVPPSYSGIK